MNTAAKGAAFERTIRHYLKYIDADYVMRSAASKGVFDLIALHDGQVLFIQCKGAKRGATKAEYRALEEASEKLYQYCKVVMVDKVRGWSEYDTNGYWVAGVSWHGIKSGAKLRKVEPLS